MEYVDEYALENLGKTPTMREIGTYFKMSNVTAFRYLREMTELGMLTYRDGEIHTEVIDKFHTNMEVVGSISFSVPAGTPVKSNYKVQIKHNSIL